MCQSDGLWSHHDLSRRSWTASAPKWHNRAFKVLLEVLSAEYGDLLLHTEIRWLSRGRVLQRLSLLGEIKEIMESTEDDIALLQDTEWMLDLTFLTDITGKLNHTNCELQCKGKNVWHYRCCKHIQSQAEHFLCASTEEEILALSLCAVNAKWQCFWIWGLGQGCRKIVNS